MGNTFNILKSRSTLTAGVTRAERVRWTVSMVLAALCALVAGFSLWNAPAAVAESCPNAASRQGPSIDLPECRAYEQVTPVDKGDAVDIFGNSVEEGSPFVDPGNQAYVAEEGSAILVQTDGSFAPQATEAASAYVFLRGAAGWNMSVLAQPIDKPQEVEETELVDPRNLSAVGFVDQVGTHGELFSGEPSAFQETGLVGPAGGPDTPLYSTTGLATFNPEDDVLMMGGSEDLSRVVLEGEDHSLAAGAEAQDPGTEALYEAAGGAECNPATSKCTLVDVNPEGKPMPCGATLGQGVHSRGGAHSAVSSDGSRIFFTAPEPGGGGESEVAQGLGCWNQNTPQENPPELYMREDGERTVEILIPHEEGVKAGTPENPLWPAVFVGASSDGSKIFFMTRTRLTKGAVGEAPELYEYNTEPAAGKKALTLISSGSSETVEGKVDSVTAVSSDGSTVYFSAFGKLAESAQEYNPRGTEPFSPVNLYRYDTTTGVTTFVTTLNNDDYPLSFVAQGVWYSHEFENFGGDGAEQEGLSNRQEWYTTKDGQFLVFGTVLPLTGFDNTPAPDAHCPDNYGSGAPPERCFELYRYDAATNKIVCVSCAGSTPVDGAYFARTVFRSPASGPPRPISEDGEDVFFDSASALVPQAVPGRVHVYEWHEGVISLLSSPSDPGNAFLLGSNADGSDVFFMTHAQLSAQDTDQSADIYDARVGGGFAGLTPSQCTGTGCQGVPAAAPIFATPASATFEGVGNFPVSEPPPAKTVTKQTTPKCKRGLVRKKVKKKTECIKPKKKAKKSNRGRGK